MSQLLGSRALTEKWANIEAHTGLEREKGLCSNWVAPQDSEAISDFRGPRASAEGPRNGERQGDGRGENEVDLRRDNARAESFELLRIGAADERHLYSVPPLFMKCIAAQIRLNFFK